jgi:hypothetical protein
VDTLLYVKLELLRRHERMMRIFPVRVRLHLVADVLGIAETAQVPSGPLNTGELPAAVPESVRTDALEELGGRDDRPEPGLARKQVVERILEHPHVDRVQDVRQLLKRYDTQVWNLIHVTDHDDGPVRDVLDAPKNTLALVLFTGPWILIFGRLLGCHNDMFNLVEPLGIPVFILFKKQLFGTSHVVHFGLDKYETIHVPVKNLEAKFEDTQLVIEHERVYEHLYL